MLGKNLPLLVLVLVVAVTAYFLFFRPPVSTPLPATVTSDWKTFNGDGADIDYPDYLANFVSSKSFSLTVDSQTEITAQFKKYADNGGCPSTCGQLADDPKLVEKQFQLLSQVADLPNCQITPALKDDISQNYILQSGGLGSKYLVDTIKNASDQCGIKLIKASGFDVSLRNFYYSAGFLKGDKFLTLSAQIYPIHAFPEVDNFWTSLGYDLADDSCSASCVEAQTKYFENFSVSDPLVKKVVLVYDQMVSTLKVN